MDKIHLWSVFMLRNVDKICIFYYWRLYSCNLYFNYLYCDCNLEFYCANEDSIKIGVSGLSVRNHEYVRYANLLSWFIHDEKEIIALQTNKTEI